MMDDVIKKLSDPFPPQRVSWRVGRVIKPGEASALCYIDARDVMERLDEAVGPGNWQDSYCETPKGRVICNLQVRVGDAWVSKSDGAGDTAVEAEKGALSDAFKRAAVKWGIGRYLYDIPTQYVRIDEKKRILKSEAGKLERALPGSRVADDGEPDEPGHGHATNGSKPPPLPRHLTQEGIAEFEREIVRKLGTVKELDALDMLWRNEANARLREIGPVDKLAQHRIVAHFSEKKAELLGASKPPANGKAETNHMQG